MRHDVYRCDICGDSYKPEYGRTVEVVIGKEPDPSGNGYVNNTKLVDCCQGCVALALIAWTPLREKVFGK